jgi:general L-amino acid transport system substrate-binding protein
MRLWLALTVLLLTGAQIIGAWAMPAMAGVLERVRAEGILHCGGTIRPGLAFPGPDGTLSGLEVDLCRAVAVAVLGPKGKVDFHGYILPASYDPLRQGSDELAFLTESEILDADLAPVVVPGSPVFFETIAALVPEASAARHVADLAGLNVCAEPGTGAERSIAPWFAARRLALSYFPFQESDEELDAYYAGHCSAMVNEMTSIAAIRIQAAGDGHPSRMLPEPLAAYPIMTVTGLDDARWSALVSWILPAVMRSQPAADTVATTFGLKPDWQRQMRQATGDYDAIFRRNLGTDSKLDLPPGLNTLWSEGGLFCPPYSE